MSTHRFSTRTAAFAGATLLALGSLSGCSFSQTSSGPASQSAVDSSSRSAADSASSAGQSEGASVAITAEEVKAMMDEGTEFVLLDVRTPEEFAAAHIDGAVNLSHDLVDANTAAEVIPSKDTKVVLYCRSGNRTGQTVPVLHSLGYTQVYDMGAMSSWTYGYVEG